MAQIHVKHSSTWNQARKALKTSAERKAEKQILEMSGIIYLAFDYMSYLEFKDLIGETPSFRYQKMFEDLYKAKKNKEAL